MQIDSNSTVSGQLQAAVRRLLDDARDTESERRSESREPFFAEVTITLAGRLRFTGFSRDISPEGIGLMHYMALEREEIIVAIPSLYGHVRIRARIVWCKPCGQGWYLSGARFLEMLQGDEIEFLR